MKRIKYQIFQSATENGTVVLAEADIPYSEENLAVAQREAYKGEYTIVDDGQPEPETPDTGTVTWEELDTAYQEGVDSV